MKPLVLIMDGINILRVMNFLINTKFYVNYISIKILLE